MTGTEGGQILYEDDKREYLCKTHKKKEARKGTDRVIL